jgi:hypothetical protein
MPLTSARALVSVTALASLQGAHAELLFSSSYVFPSHSVFADALSDVAATPSICKEGGAGLFLPFGGDQHQEYKLGVAMCVPYLMGLLWCFMGVGIVSDIFMAGIETITSQTNKVTRPDGTAAEVKVWNATVANLTLMALGSSAPEIILSVIEILSLSVNVRNTVSNGLVASAPAKRVHPASRAA